MKGTREEIFSRYRWTTCATNPQPLTCGKSQQYLRAWAVLSFGQTQPFGVVLPLIVGLSYCWGAERSVAQFTVVILCGQDHSASWFWRGALGRTGKSKESSVFELRRPVLFMDHLLQTSCDPSRPQTSNSTLCKLHGCEVAGLGWMFLIHAVLSAFFRSRIHVVPACVTLIPTWLIQVTRPVKHFSSVQKSYCTYVQFMKNVHMFTSFLHV